MESFTNEILKIAGPSNFLARIGSMPRGLRLGIAGAGGAGVYAHGKGKGRQEGRAQGAKQTRLVAERAYKVGVVRGARAMHSQILQRMRAFSGAQK
ncbi:MAG: hypothetical protein DRP42_00685 [Tenericutes bacterium]|nr:MAG: hypothetical protein DRP42_00685 [Mycoplasmatota bacterium]